MIIKKVGPNKGTTLAVFAGTHGNEQAGIKAMQNVLDKVTIKNGIVYFVLANPEAIKQNVRYVEKNLNRCFLKDNRGQTLEDKRAKELMKILDQSIALLDLHSSNSLNTTPFVIVEKAWPDIVLNLGFDIVSSGWDKLEPGTADGYMYNNGKVGLCLECGSVSQTDDNIKLAEKSIYQFLQYYDIIEKQVEYSRRKQKVIEVNKVVLRKTDDFSFVKKFADFELLLEGKVFAQDGEHKYIAGKNECIIFPRLNCKIGEEIFIIGNMLN